MLNNIHFYIGDTEVEFEQIPEILYTYQIDDLTNPTIIKNSFSKSITVKGTKTNNNLFGHFWNVQRTQTNGSLSSSGIYFNASKKMNFSLFVDTELYEEGYVKLEEVRLTNKNNYEYDITLYGSLGDFFYNLSLNSDGNEMKLSDLEFNRDLSFTINIETIKKAWETLKSTQPIKQTNIWKTINFMPCYNGLPDDFDSNKLLIDTTNTSLTKVVEEEGVTYRPYNNEWVLATLPDNVTEWEVRDIRSYLQRPVIRMKEIITACCNPINNGGYNVNLDTDFFNKDNPYYEDTWITLPLLNSLEYNNTSQLVENSTLIGDNTIGNTTEYMYQPLSFTLGEYPSESIKNVQLKATINLSNINAKSTSHIWFYRNNANGIHNNFYCLGSLFVQLLAYNGDVIVGASDVYNLTTPIRHNGGLYYGKNEDYTDGKYFTPFLNKRTYNVLGEFKNGDFYRENENEPAILNLNIDNVNSTITSLKMVYFWGANKQKIKKYTSPSLFEDYKEVSMINYEILAQYITNPQSHNLSINQTNINAVLLENLGKTGTQITKQLLLNTEYTPADYLLSFCKMFGLYFTKDPNSNTINIETRKSFYNRQSIIDIQSDIDYSKGVTISPLTFENKWIEFKQEQYETNLSKDYKLTYGVDYGCKKINTGYDFNAETKSLLEDNILHSAIEVLDKSIYYTAYNNDNKNRPLFNAGIEYNLYNGDKTIDVKPSININNTILSLNENAELKYYDLFPKIQFSKDNKPTDGNNVLVFFNGFKSTTEDRANPIYYQLSDDNYYQNKLNTKGCWCFASSNKSLNGVEFLSIIDNFPIWERLKTSNNGITVTKSLDFGDSNLLYVPNYQLQTGSSIYDNFWKNYLSDLYNVDNKVVTVYVNLFRSKIGYDLLKQFYYFDNSIWRIHKIEDWGIGANDTVKVTFVKVIDVENYTSITQNRDNIINIKPSTYNISSVGGKVDLTILSDKNIGWEITGNTDMVFSKDKGIGNDFITVTFPQSNSNEQIVHNISIQDAEGNITKVNIIQSYVGQTSFNIKPNVILIPNNGGKYEINYIWKNQGDNVIDTFEVLGDIDVDVTLNDYSCTVFATESKSKTEIKRGNVLLHNNVYGDELFMEQVPSQLNFSKEGGTYKFQWWYATVKYSDLPYWIGVKEDTLTILPNYYDTERSSSIRIENENTVVYVEIKQEKGVGLPTELPKITPDAIYFERYGGEQFISVNISNTWVLTETLDWLTLSLTNGDKNSIIKATVDYNTGDTRKGYITLKNNLTKEEYKVYVSQLGDLSVREVTVEPTVLNVDYKGGDFDLTINFQSRNGSFVDVITDLTHTDFNWVEDIGTMKISIPINKDKIQKTYTVTFSTVIGDYTVTINQSEVIDLIDFDNNDISTSKEAKILPIEVTTNFDWYVEEFPEWIGMNIIQGSEGKEYLDIYISENDTVLDRYVAIVFRNKYTNEYVDTLRITQKGKDEILTVTPNKVYMDGLGGTIELAIENNSEWTIELV